LPGGDASITLRSPTRVFRIRQRNPTLTAARYYC
jgi:hypothetical protein